MAEHALSAYGKYQQSRNASWQCLIDCGVDRLPVVVSDIAAQLSVKLCEYGDNEALLRRHHLDPLLKAAGFAYADPGGQLLIFFNEKDSPSICGSPSPMSWATSCWAMWVRIFPRAGS